MSEYTKKYASDKFQNHVYLIQDYCDSQTEFDGLYLFYDFMSGRDAKLHSNERIEIIREIFKISSQRLVLLSKNNIYYFEQKKGDSIKSLGSNIIFIAQDINPHDPY